MKIAMTALAVLLMAPAGVALAAPGDRERVQFEDRAERPRREFRERREAPQARRAPEAAQAPEAPQAPRASEGPRRGGGEGRRAEGRRGGDRRSVEGQVVGRPGLWVDDDGDNSADRSDADRFDREDRQEARDARRWQDGNREDARRRQGQGGLGVRDPDRDPRTWEGRGDRNDGRRDWRDRWDRTDRDRWGRHDRDRDRRRGNRPYWSQGRYAFSYHSPRRYRGGHWRAPSGFYIRSWSFGDYLPWGWYGDSYRLDDWWAYGLPWPPPGYDWVRVGPDVLLVDRFSGRIVQVVRMVFW